MMNSTLRDMSDRMWVDDSTILRTEVGSGVHGTAVSGQDDHDEMGICIEPLELAVSTRGEFEHHTARTAEQRTGISNTPSSPGDTDLIVYSLRKWTRLALNGNPTVLTVLFAPQPSILKIDARGSQLRDLGPCFASKRAGRAFLGYLRAQRQRLEGTRGQRNVNRARLVDAFGFDTKYASHIVRLGYQGIEFLATGRITLPVPEPHRSEVIAIKTGKWTENRVMTLAGELEKQLQDAIDVSPLPDEPETEKINLWMLDTYLAAWTAGYGHDRHMQRLPEILFHSGKARD